MKLPVAAIIAASGLITLSACDPQTGAGKGAVVGATTGAVVGGVANSDNRARGAVIGATGGAVVGAIAGDIMSQQARSLEQSFNNPNIRVVNRGSYLQVVMPSAILFQSSSASVSPAAHADLNVLARNLLEFPHSIVEVVGHTDNTGSAAYNRDLSHRRAQSVGSILIQGGVPPSRIRTTGRGFDQPIATNATPEGRAQNRRVEILIHPTR